MSESQFDYYFNPLGAACFSHSFAKSVNKKISNATDYYYIHITTPTIINIIFIQIENGGKSFIIIKIYYDEWKKGFL